MFHFFVTGSYAITESLQTVNGGGGNSSTGDSSLLHSTPTPSTPAPPQSSSALHRSFSDSCGGSSDDHKLDVSPPHLYDQHGPPVDFYGSPSQQQGGSGNGGGSGSGSAAPEQKYRPPSGGLGRMNSGECGWRLVSVFVWFCEFYFQNK